MPGKVEDPSGAAADGGDEGEKGGEAGVDEAAKV